eukprot:6201619-Pleurochrysis_carterae.AAC.2
MDTSLVLRSTYTSYTCRALYKLWGSACQARLRSLDLEFAAHVKASERLIAGLRAQSRERILANALNGPCQRVEQRRAPIKAPTDDF